MDRTQVKSTSIKSVGYDQATHTLEIEFQSGAIYQYREIPESVHANLMSARSHGEYFHANIRGRYKELRIR